MMKSAHSSPIWLSLELHLTAAVGVNEAAYLLSIQLSHRHSLPVLVRALNKDKVFESAAVWFSLPEIIT